MQAEFDMKCGLELFSPYNTPEMFRHYLEYLDIALVVKTPALACGAVPSIRVKGQLRKVVGEGWRVDESYPVRPLLDMPICTIPCA